MQGVLAVSTARAAVASVVPEMAKATTDAYTQALRREILRSEQQRMRTLAIVLTLLLATILLLLGFFPGFSRQLFPQGISAWVPIVGFGSFIAIEVAALGLMRWRIAKDLDFPRPAS